MVLDIKNDLLKPVLDVIESYTYVPCIIAFQSKGHAPALPYITAYISKVSTIGEDCISKIDDNDQVTIKADKEIMVSLKALGANAMGILENLHTVYSHSFTPIPWSMGTIEFVNRGDIIPLNPLKGSQYDEVAATEIKLRVGVKTRLNAEYFTAVNINGEVIYGNKSKGIQID